MTIIKNSFGLNFMPWWPFPWFYSPMSPAPPWFSSHVPRSPWFYSPCPPFHLGSTSHVPRSALVLLPTSPAPPWFYSPYPPLHLGSTGTTPVTHSPWLYSPCSPVLLPQSPIPLGSTPSAPPVLLPLSPTPLGSTPSFPMYPWLYSPRFYSRSPPLPLVLPKVLHSPCYYWKSSLNVISNCACLWFILQLLNS